MAKYIVAYCKYPFKATFCNFISDEAGSLYVLFLILNLGEEERSTDYGHFEAYTPGKPSIKAARRKEIHEGV